MHMLQVIVSHFFILLFRKTFLATFLIQSCYQLLQLITFLLINMRSIFFSDKFTELFLFF